MGSASSGARQALAALVALGLVVAACTAQPTTSEKVAVDDADPDGELVTNLGSEPDTIDPHIASFVNQIAVIMKVFEGLMTLEPTTLRPVPAVAAKEPEVSADGKTWKFTVREGVKFSDGNPVTAADFARGFTRTCDPKVAGSYSFVLYVIVGCAEWNTMDPKKATPADLDAAKAKLGIKAEGNVLTFSLNQPAPYFGSIAYMWVGMPVQQKSLDEGGSKWTEPATYIGDGPFKLVEWKHNEKMVFERNDLYWRGAPKLKRWTTVMINEPAVAFAAYRANDLDLFNAGAEDLRAIESDPQLKAESADYPGSCTNYISFNTRRVPFDDPNVRLAFAKGFDRDGYISDIIKLGAPANGGFIPPGFPGYDKDDPAQRFDPAAAKALLAKSKYTLDQLQGLKLTYGSNARAKTRVEWLQGQWKANLGITIALDPIDSTAFQALSRSKDPSVKALFVVLGWCADFPHQQNWLTTVFHSRPDQLPEKWKNEEFDRLLDQADRESKSDVADPVYLKASRLLSQDAPAAWLNYSAIKSLRKPWVRGVTSSAIDAALGEFRAWEIYVTKH